MAKTKKERKGDALSLIIIIILLGVIVVSLFNIVRLMGKYQVGTSAYNKVAEKVGAANQEEFSLDWDQLLAVNKDTVAWLRDPDTVINYPVAQGADDEFYLHHLITGESDFKGCLFMAAANNRKFKDFNTIIYGHNMKDGSMFHSLVEYRDPKYYEKHRVIQLYTPKKTYNLEVFAAMEIPSDSPLYKINFASDDERADYLNDIEAASDLDTDVVTTVQDHIVMLSTCAYDFKEARMVVYGVMREV